MNTNGDTTKSCKVTNKKGLHARAAAQIVSTSSEYNCQITISHRGKTANSLSLIKLLTLDAPQGSLLEIKASGTEAAQAVQAISELIENGFGELDL